jgi:hypothetical protein
MQLLGDVMKKAFSSIREFESMDEQAKRKWLNKKGLIAPMAIKQKLQVLPSNHAIEVLPGGLRVEVAKKKTFVRASR